MEGAIAEGINLDGDAKTGLTSLTGDKGVDNEFYRALGFTETLRLPGYYRGLETAVRMIRVLRPPKVTAQPFHWRPPTRDDR